MIEPEVAKLSTFELLGTYLKVLYVIEYYGKAILDDIVREFPGDKIQTLKMDKAYIKVGKMNQEAVVALEDLIKDGLVKVFVRPYEIEPSQSFKETIDLLERTGEISKEEKEKLLRKYIESDPHYQGEEYWCIDEKGNRIKLTHHGVFLVLSLTDKGKRIWELLSTARERIFKELLHLE